MLHLHFLTLFPQTIEPWLTTSIVGRAHEKGLFAYYLHQLRDYSTDRHRSVDDVAYGGGGGMVLKLEPLVTAVETLRAQWAPTPLTTIYFSPGGQKLNQNLLDEYAPTPGVSRRFLFICGHYEGVDQRFLDHWVDKEVSLGDFVLTGGEIPAVAMADALIRQLDGALGQSDGAHKESFRLEDSPGGAKLLEYPHFTRPAEFRGWAVPPVLLSGNHEEIARWRSEQALERTRRLRPDLLS